VSVDDKIATDRRRRRKPNSSTTGLLEIKSLWGRRNSGSLTRFEHCPNRFYDQIQTQLAVCDLEWCDLMCYIPPNGSGGEAKNTRRNRKRANGTKTNNNKKKKNQRHQIKLKKRLKDRRREKREREQQLLLLQQERGGDSDDHLVHWYGQNYCIVRVMRNETYWNETLVPAILQFCRDVNNDDDDDDE